MIDTDPKRLREIISLNTEIAEVKDFDVLMERILSAAREFVHCDAGSIYIKRDDHLEFSYAQNDTLTGRLTPGQKLIYTTFKVPINTNSISGYVALKGKTLNIEDAYNLPSDLPFCFDRSYDESACYRTQSILTVPLKTRNKKIIGVLQLINRLDDNGDIIRFDPELEPYVAFFASSAASALAQAQLTRTIILRMISMAELRDPTETSIHVNRVAGYAVEIYETWAKRNGVSTEDINNTRDVLRMAAMLHDVGKIAISDLILKKPARLNEDEYEIMKRHTVLGAKLFQDATSPFEEAAREVALNHHERYDGRGYPGFVNPVTGEPIGEKTDDDGNPYPKKGAEIPLFGRIVALADVYDALSTTRAYKKAWDEDRVLRVIRDERGRHFDPEIVDAFLSIMPTIRSIGKRYAS